MTTSPVDSLIRRPIGRGGARPQISCSAASRYRRESCCSRIRRCTICTGACSRVSSLHGECWPWKTWCVTSVRVHWIRFVTRTGSTSSPTSVRPCRCARSAICWAFPRRASSRSAISTTRASQSQRDHKCQSQGLRGGDRDVRRVHRVEGESSVRRPDHGAAQRRSRGTGW